MPSRHGRPSVPPEIPQHVPVPQVIPARFPNPVRPEDREPAVPVAASQAQDIIVVLKIVFKKSYG